jgi:ATP-dependent exoDNAse (exonuclease V) beta subunit
MDILSKNLLILASAGSGKTYQLGNRIIGLVARGVAPERIVALTFTRKAAGEFADSVLTKLAEAAANAEPAAALRDTLGMPAADFADALARVVRALPGIHLGTMDGFFSKIVRGFQYELGLCGGRFDLIEGPRAAALADGMLAEILGDVLAREAGEEFFHAFRRATLGREERSVTEALRGFVKRWHARFREAPGLDWGPPAMADPDPDEWEKQKSALAAIARRGLDQIDYTRKGQRESLEKEIAHLENHTIGSGSLGSGISSLMTSILDAVATQSGPLAVKSHKEFTISGTTGDALRRMVELAAHCEFAAALQRTRALREIISVFDALCAKRLRHKGLLGFNDVKLLMGDWARDEDSRLRREAVDFRLDARLDHWLLDEFQDTSRADWTGLLPLIDEAATDESGSMFIVGDRKQAIYAWRGGDVGLFDEVISRYSGGLDIAPIAESWRSCPEVLTLVNRVCGDVATLHELFGEAANRWEWQDHVPAEPLKRPEKRGHARVEMIGDWDARLERLAEILGEVGVGERTMTCGILLRGNEKVRQVADDLRSRGFDVIEEGRRLPGSDNPVGIATTHLLKWLADPADSFSLGVLEMSPLSAALQASHGTSSWRKIWKELTTTIARYGFAAAVRQTLDLCSADWSEFGRRRAGDLIACLTALDHQGGVSIKEAAEWLERLELSQSPGVAAVQVMTIHKAKGLGFDVVILPEIPDEGVPQAQYFDVAEGPDWLTETPAKWARAVIPELRNAENRWAAAQRYEAFCVLYVALTRAKRALHVLLDTPSKTSAPDKPSLSNWLIRSIGETRDPAFLHETGSGDWIRLIPLAETPSKLSSTPGLGPATPRRGRGTPSGAKSKLPVTLHSPSGMRFGTEVHALLEQVSWIDESAPALPDTDAGRSVAALLRKPGLRHLFEKAGRNIDLLREQSADAILDGTHLTGVIDRLHLHRLPDGTIARVEIIDFKTDAVARPDELAGRYTAQMQAYREAMRLIHPQAEISCLLLSVRHAEVVAV